MDIWIMDTGRRERFGKKKHEGGEGDWFVDLKLCLFSSASSYSYLDPTRSGVFDDTPCDSPRGGGGWRALLRSESSQGEKPQSKSHTLKDESGG